MTDAARVQTGRRGFLKTSLAGLGLAGVSRTAAAAEPPRRIGGSHMKLSLAAYSFNRQLTRRGSAEELSRAEMTLDDFVIFCAEQDLDGCELTSYYFPREVTQEYLLHLKGLAFRQGLDVSGTAIGNDFCLPPGEARDRQLAMTREWIDHAAALGAPVIRIFAGRVPKNDTLEAALERCVAGIDESLDYAAQKGVFLALENHGGITATPGEMLEIVKRVKPSPWFGVNLDGGNFRTEDPYADLAEIAPYAINAQLKVEISRGEVKEKADLARIVKILRDADYRGYVVLEYEARENPYENIPRYLRELRELISA